MQCTSIIVLLVFPLHGEDLLQTPPPHTDWTGSAVSPSPTRTYLRREGLRIKSQKREDAFSPKWRSEGKHQTENQLLSSGGGTEEEVEEEDEPPRRRARHGSAHDPLSVRAEAKSSAKWEWSLSTAQLWRQTRSAEVRERATWLERTADICLHVPRKNKC